MIIFVVALCLLVGVSIALTCSTDYRIDNFLTMIDILENRIDQQQKQINTLSDALAEQSIRIDLMNKSNVDYVLYGGKTNGELERRKGSN